VPQKFLHKALADRQAGHKVPIFSADVSDCSSQKACVDHSIIVICPHVAYPAAEALESSRDIQSIIHTSLRWVVLHIPCLHKHAAVLDSLSRGGRAESIACVAQLSFSLSCRPSIPLCTHITYGYSQKHDTNGIVATPNSMRLTPQTSVASPTTAYISTSPQPPSAHCLFAQNIPTNFLAKNISKFFYKK